MGHIKFTEHRSGLRDPEWLPVGRAIADIANQWSGRHDIIAYVGEGAGNGSPACFIPPLAEVEIDVTLAFGKGTTPEKVGDLTTRSKQYEYASAMGSIIHEAFHARYSQYDLVEAAKHLNNQEHHALLLLEEGRIEAQGVANFPRALPFVSTSAMTLVIADSEEQLNAEGITATDHAATLVALVHARVDAGILTSEDTKAVRDIVDAYFSEDVLARLRDVARRAQEHVAHAYPQPLYELAREWVRILNEVKEERGEDSGEGEGGAAEEMEALGKALAEAMGEAKARSSLTSQDALDEQEEREDWDEQSKERAKEAKEREKDKERAKEVFGSGTAALPTSRSGSRLVEQRAPRSDERVAAVMIAKALERAKYRDRSEVEIVSVTPPGRLRTRALVQGAALKSRGVQTQVEPWRRTARKQTDDPTLNVGILVDISGSMSAAMEPMATTAWVMSEAVRRVQGKAAMVYFGSDVFSTLKPGEHLTEVNVYTAPDGTEKFDDAFRAVDGGLNLINGTGARLLVVVSDGHYVADEFAKATATVARCARSGVAVLWLPFTSHAIYAERIVGRNGRIVSGVMDPTTAASEIGRAATEALLRLGTAA
jgi:hypothetical protein